MSTTAPKHPSLDGCLYFDASGKRITRAEFTKAAPSSKTQSYPVTIAEFARHFAAVQEYMRSTEEVGA
jgi:hypothetical protein